MGEKVSSPCINSISHFNSLEISNSIFNNNHCRYFSNCLGFSGKSLKIYNSSFINNSAIFSVEMERLFLSKITGVDDIAMLNPEVGGNLYFSGIQLTIEKSVFLGGTGFKGGAIYITAYFIEIYQSVLISQSLFKYNRGNIGGVINFSLFLHWIDAVINSCVFISNIGKSGGVVGYEYHKPQCHVLVVDSYGFNNTAMFAGFANIETIDALCTFRNCFFEGNIGYSFLLKVGGGAVIGGKGLGSSLTLTQNCFFFSFWYHFKRHSSGFQRSL